MRIKLNYLYILIIILLLSWTVTAVNIDKGKFDKNKYKRVIADNIGKEEIQLFEENGCLIKHRLKGSVSFKCPEGFSEEFFGLKVREVRVFRVSDLEAIQQIKADKVWGEGINGEGVNVVILDTGIDSTHVELSEGIKGQKDFVNNDDIAEDDNGHGTHVAGIIIGKGINEINNNYATGVSPGARIYMLKVCDGNGDCYEDDIMAAIDYSTGLDSKIMSISLGSGNYNGHCDSDPLAEKINWLVDNGFTVVVAAGNEGIGVSSPACASKAIAVGAVDKNNIVPYWSNRGSALDILAPGVDILSSYSCLAAGDCNSYWYAYMSGTSMSAPHVSGVVALLLETKPDITTNEIKNALYNTATSPAGCEKCRFIRGGRCYRPSVIQCTSEDKGAGIVNAYEAYLSIKPTEPDSDSDGVSDSQDACPTVYGTDCNGCLNPCSGCVIMSCPPAGIPVCEAGICQDTICQANRCGGECAENEYGTYVSSENTCEVIGNIGTCTNNPCNLDCTYSSECEIQEVQCWSAEFQYLKRDRDQAKKFCKCAEGTYSYQAYSRISGRGTTYEYSDSENNENWETSLTSNYYKSPIYRVRCNDGDWYNTNQDYFFE